jgi:hypothetical protein
LPSTTLKHNYDLILTELVLHQVKLDHISQYYHRGIE